MLRTSDLRVWKQRIAKSSQQSEYANYVGFNTIENFNKYMLQHRICEIKYFQCFFQFIYIFLNATNMSPLNFYYFDVTSNLREKSCGIQYQK